MKSGLCAIILFTLISSNVQAFQELKISAQQQSALGIETAPLAGNQSREAQGFPARVVLPNNQLFIVSTPLAGVVEQMLASSNASVSKGQVLARIQSPSLSEIERGFLQAETQHQLADENLGRDKKLFDEGIISQSRYLATRSRHVEANAALLERKQMLKLAGVPEAAIQKLANGNNLSSTLDIVSPIEGVVLEQMAVSGQRVDMATPLYQVAKLSPLWLEIQVPAAKLAEIRDGDSVSIAAYNASGKITSIGRSINPATQTAVVRAIMNKNIDSLRPGLQIEAQIAGSASDFWQIRNSSLIREQGKAFVFVRTAAGFRATEVKVVSEGAGSSMVSGLKGNENIAVRGVAALKSALQGGN